MSQHSVVEHVEFELLPGVSESDFLAASEEISRWTACQPGFEYRCLTRGEDGRWLDLVFWSNEDHARRAGRRIMEEKGRSPFMRMIDDASVRIAHRPVMGRKAPAGLLLTA
ncbi:MAG: hypothetical protein AAFU61_14635 [Pseudomonadota bacterium]